MIFARETKIMKSSMTQRLPKFGPTLSKIVTFDAGNANLQKMRPISVFNVPNVCIC